MSSPDAEIADVWVDTRFPSWNDALRMNSKGKSLLLPRQGSPLLVNDDVRIDNEMNVDLSRNKVQAFNANK